MEQERSAKAPWRDLLASHLKQTQGYTFNIATVIHDRGNDLALPRVRTCGCRGFFPELELHPSGQKDMDEQVENGGNPEVYESDMLTFTTDVRMEKLPQLNSSYDAIEATFWLEDLMTQWRIKGRALCIGSGFGEEEIGENEDTARNLIRESLRTKNCNADVTQWTWENAITKYFANHSPAMRGSFRNPPPGRPRSQAPSDPSLSLGQKVTDLYDPVARANFRVVAIMPEEVERLDISNQEDVQREKWIYIDSDTSDIISMETSDDGSIETSPSHDVLPSIETSDTGYWEHMDLWP